MDIGNFLGRRKFNNTRGNLLPACQLWEHVIKPFHRVKEIKNRIESLKESLGATGKNSDASEGYVSLASLFHKTLTSDSQAKRRNRKRALNFVHKFEYSQCK